MIELSFEKGKKPNKMIEPLPSIEVIAAAIGFTVIVKGSIEGSEAILSGRLLGAFMQEANSYMVFVRIGSTDFRVDLNEGDEISIVGLNDIGSRTVRKLTVQDKCYSIKLAVID